MTTEDKDSKRLSQHRHACRYGRKTHDAITKIAFVINRGYNKTGEIILETVCEELLKLANNDPNFSNSFKNNDKQLKAIRDLKNVIREKTVSKVKKALLDKKSDSESNDS